MNLTKAQIDLLLQLLKDVDRSSVESSCDEWHPNISDPELWNELVDLDLVYDHRPCSSIGSICSYFIKLIEEK